MLIRIILLPFTLVKYGIGLILGIIKLIIGTIFNIVMFVIHRVFGVALGALIGFFFGSSNIRIRMPWDRNRKKKSVVPGKN